MQACHDDLDAIRDPDAKRAARAMRRLVTA